MKTNTGSHDTKIRKRRKQRFAFRKEKTKMSYTQQQLDDFWWGPGGSATKIKPGAYVTMREADVTYLKATDPVWNALLTYCFVNKLYGFGTEGRTLWDGTGSNSVGWIGPILS